MKWSVFEKDGMSRITSWCSGLPSEQVKENLMASRDQGKACGKQTAAGGVRLGWGMLR